jgi:hypothetical protein
MAIPLHIHTYWSGARDAITDLCLRRIASVHPDWRVSVMSECEEPCPGLEALRVEHQSDWARICAIERHGGVWLDASCVCVRPVSAWVDMDRHEVQGFSAPGEGERVLENWAFAAPVGHPLVVAWKRQLRRAIVMGFDAFRDTLPAWLEAHPVYAFLPYLTMHACYLLASHETGLRATMSKAEDGPFVHLRDAGGNSSRAVYHLLTQPLDGDGAEPPPLIKITGGGPPYQRAQLNQNLYACSPRSLVGALLRPSAVHSLRRFHFLAFAEPLLCSRGGVPLQAVRLLEIVVLLALVAAVAYRVARSDHFASPAKSSTLFA